MIATKSPRLWVNDDRTVLVREYADGTMEVAFRDEPGAIWGPPVVVVEETDEWSPRRVA